MSTEHIETVIIGAGQAGLSTGVPPAKRGPRRASSWTATRGSATTGAGIGTRCGSTARRSTTASRACRSRPTRGRFPQKDEVAAFLESYALQFDLPVRMSTRVDAPGAAARRRAIVATHRRRHDQLRQRGRGDRHLRADAEHPGLRQSTSTRRSGNCTPASTAARPPPARTGAGRGRLALGHGHRLRGRRRRNPTILCGRDRGQIPSGQSSSSVARVIFPVVDLHVAARPHPADADRAQGDERGPVPRRPDAPGQARGTWPRAASSGTRPAWSGVQGGMPLLDDGTVHRRSRTSSGAPGSGRCSTGSSCR